MPAGTKADRSTKRPTPSSATAGKDRPMASLASRDQPKKTPAWQTHPDRFHPSGPGPECYHNLPRQSKAREFAHLTQRQKSSGSSSVQGFLACIKWTSLAARTHVAKPSTLQHHFSGDHGEYHGFVVMVDVRHAGDALESHKSRRSERATDAGAAKLRKPQLGTHDLLDPSDPKGKASVQATITFSGAD